MLDDKQHGVFAVLNEKQNLKNNEVSKIMDSLFRRCILSSDDLLALCPGRTLNLDEGFALRFGEYCELECEAKSFAS